MHNFTINYQFKKMVRCDYDKDDKNCFLSECIRESFEPSKESLDNIMSFAKAYCYIKSNRIDGIECVKN